MTAEIYTIVGVGIGLATLMWRMLAESEDRSEKAHAAIGESIAEVKQSIAELKQDLCELKAQVSNIDRRLARVEGVLSVQTWRTDEKQT